MYFCYVVLLLLYVQPMKQSETPSRRARNRLILTMKLLQMDLQLQSVYVIDMTCHQFIFFVKYIHVSF